MLIYACLGNLLRLTRKQKGGVSIPVQSSVVSVSPIKLMNRSKLHIKQQMTHPAHQFVQFEQKKDSTVRFLVNSS